jgi:hypothetical protein
MTKTRKLTSAIYLAPSADELADRLRALLGPGANLSGTRAEIVRRATETLNAYDRAMSEKR